MGSTVVKAICRKSEGRGFETPMRLNNFYEFA
jgi:hypothetical protein